MGGFDQALGGKPLRNLKDVGGSGGGTTGVRCRHRPGDLPRPGRRRDAALRDLPEATDAGVVEGTDQHPILSPEAGDLVGDHGFDSRLLEIEVEEGIRERAECVLEQGHHHSLAALWISPGLVELMCSIERPQGLPVVIPEATLAVGKPLQRVVMEQHDSLVTRHMEVGLEVAIPEIDRTLEGHHRVLRPHSARPAVRKANGVLVRQVGLHQRLRLR